VLAVALVAVLVSVLRPGLAPRWLALSILALLVLAVAFNFTDASFQVWPWLVLGVARVATVQATRQYWEIRAKRPPEVRRQFVARRNQPVILT